MTINNLTQFSIDLSKQYADVLNCAEENLEHRLEIFRASLRELSDYFGIEQQGEGVSRRVLDEAFIKSLYTEILKQNPETVILEEKDINKLPIHMSVDAMPVEGDKVAILETNGFTGRGLALGNIFLISESLFSLFKTVSPQTTFFLGYLFSEGKEDDLLYEKLIYLGELSKRLKENGMGVRISTIDDSSFKGEALRIFFVPSQMGKELELKQGEFFLRGIKVDYASENLIWDKDLAKDPLKVLNPNFRISDSKEATYKALEKIASHPDIYRLEYCSLTSPKEFRLIEELAEKLIDKRGVFTAVVKPDDASGGRGLSECYTVEMCVEKLLESFPKYPKMVVMERAPLKLANLDRKIGNRTAGLRLEEVMKNLSYYYLGRSDIEIPKQVISGKHAFDFRFYIAIVSGEVVEREIGMNADKNRFYLYPFGGIIRLAPTPWIEDVEKRCQDASILKTNISQFGLQGDNIVRQLLPNEETLNILGVLPDFYKNCLKVAFAATKTTT